MTVNEMHIAVNLGVQKLASFQVDNLLPEEIDHELNLAQLRFVKQRFNARSNRQNKGFEQSQKRIDDLKSLIVEHQDNTQFYGEVYTSKYSPIYVDRYTLPLDYLFLVSVRAETKYSCTAVPEQRKIVSSLRYVKFDLNPPVKGYLLKDLYVFKSSNTTWTKINTIDLTTNEKLMNSDNYISDIHPVLALPEQNSAGITQHISPNVDSNHLYLQFKFNIALDVVSDELDPLYNKCFYSVWVNPLDNTQTAISYFNEFITLSTETRDFRTNSEIPLYNRICYCTFAQHDDIYALLDDPFNKTDYDLPFYNIEESYLDIYTTNMFIAKKAIIKYLRKPIAISYNLGTGSELPFHTHEEIVEMTIKSILEGLESQRYNTQSMETFESE
jgi:hypothetical protein